MRADSLSTIDEELVCIVVLDCSTSTSVYLNTFSLLITFSELFARITSVCSHLSFYYIPLSIKFRIHFFDLIFFNKYVCYRLTPVICANKILKVIIDPNIGKNIRLSTTNSPNPDNSKPTRSIALINGITDRLSIDFNHNWI